MGEWELEEGAGPAVMTPRGMALLKSAGSSVDIFGVAVRAYAEEK